MKERIEAELAGIENRYEVRLLFAVESGSRAWGFASPDSDYDVRFVYAHRRDWYLSVFEQRDVIEEMLPDDLDISGWELRKALRLFSKCNAALNEWLGSPIVYCETPGFRPTLAALMPAYFNPVAAMHHYRRMAEHALADSLQERRIGIKKLFYALRAILACRWIANVQAQPPTEFTRLLAADWISIDERIWIEAHCATRRKQSKARRRNCRLSVSKPYTVRRRATKNPLKRWKPVRRSSVAPVISTMYSGAGSSPTSHSQITSFGGRGREVIVAPVDVHDRQRSEVCIRHVVDSRQHHRDQRLAALTLAASEGFDAAVLAE